MIQINPDGIVLDSGSIVGNVQDGNFTPAEGLHHKKLAKVTKEVDAILSKSQGGSESAEAHNLGDAGSTPAPATNSKPSETDEAPAAAQPLSPPAAKGGEPEPAKDPRLGDKTPAWREWLQRTNPAEYAARFANRIVG